MSAGWVLVLQGVSWGAPEVRTWGIWQGPIRRWHPAVPAGSSAERDHGTSTMTRVSVVERAKRQPLSAGACVGLLVTIVFGLLAMHSLSMLDSGAHHEAGMSLSAPAPMTAVESAPAEERALPGQAPLPDGHMFVLCGVMLAATAAAAVAWLVLRRVPRHPALTLTLHGVGGGMPSRRPRAGPPRYLTLSVCRC